MSNLVNEQIKESILDEVESMTITDFQNAVDKYGISGQTVIDEMIENLVETLFEQRSI
jgi:ribosomal protein S25